MEQKMQIVRSGQYKREELTYIQVYPQRNFEIGFVIQSPTENDEEYFYQSVEASDPKRGSFVLLIPNKELAFYFESHSFTDWLYGLSRFVRKYFEKIV